MRAATGDISLFRDLLICFRVWVGVTSASLLRRGCTVFGSVRGDFLQNLSAPCSERHDSLSRTRSAFRSTMTHSRCYTITRRNRKKRPVRLSVPVATTVEQSSCSSLCPHSNALTSNSQLLLRLHLWPDQLANVAVALELVAALRTARAVCERENAPVHKRLY